MTDEHWRDLAGLKKLNYVAWGDNTLQRVEVVIVLGGGRRTRLDEFLMIFAIRNGRRQVVSFEQQRFPKRPQ